jgi:hypothetical protein
VLSNLGQNISLSSYKLLKKIRPHSNSIDIFSQIKKTSTILFCLPNDDAGIEAFCQQSDLVNRIFSNKTIIFLIEQRNKSLFKIVGDFQMVEYSAEQMSMFGIPSGPLQEMLLRTPVDMVVDLNLSFQFVATYVAWHSKAILQVCFNHPRRDDLYNFVVRLAPHQDWHSAFKTLFKYLDPQNCYHD